MLLKCNFLQYYFNFKCTLFQKKCNLQSHCGYRRGWRNIWGFPQFFLPPFFLPPGAKTPKKRQTQLNRVYVGVGGFKRVLSGCSAGLAFGFSGYRRVWENVQFCSFLPCPCPQNRAGPKKRLVFLGLAGFTWVLGRLLVGVKRGRFKMAIQSGLGQDLHKLPKPS